MSTRKEKRKRAAMRKAATAGAAIAAGLATRSAIESSYRKTKGKPPPDQQDAKAGWKKALSWAAAIGAITSISRLLTKRGIEAGTRHQRGGVAKKLRKK